MVTFAPPKISSVPLLQKSLWVSQSDSEVEHLPASQGTGIVEVVLKEAELIRLLELFTKKQPKPEVQSSGKRGTKTSLFGGGSGGTTGDGEPSPLEP